MKPVDWTTLGKGGFDLTPSKAVSVTSFTYVYRSDYGCPETDKRAEKVEGIELSAENMRQLYVPPGFAHGFCVVAELSEVEYKCTDYYAPSDQHGVAWNDPLLGIPWPLREPVLSDKDRRYPPLTPTRADLPVYEAAER